MIGKPKELIRWLLEQDQDRLFKVDTYHRKRSLTANAYAWVLIGKIADVVRASKDEVYLMMLKRYGQFQFVSVLSDIDVSGYFKYYEPYADTVLHGKHFTHYRIYKGSSEFNSREMSVFIDGIVSEAKELGIETLPDAEIKRLRGLLT